MLESDIFKTVKTSARTEHPSAEDLMFPKMAHESATIAKEDVTREAVRRKQEPKTKVDFQMSLEIQTLETEMDGFASVIHRMSEVEREDPQKVSKAFEEFVGTNANLKAAMQIFEKLETSQRERYGKQVMGAMLRSLVRSLREVPSAARIHFFGQRLEPSVYVAEAEQVGFTPEELQGVLLACVEREGTEALDKAPDAFAAMDPVVVIAALERYSPEEAEQRLHTLAPEQQILVRQRVFMLAPTHGVPGFEKTGRQAAQQTEWTMSPEQQERDRTLIRESREAEQALAQAIFAEYPERAKHEIERSRIQAEISDVISSVDVIRVKSANKPTKINLGPGVTAAYKPKRNEQGGLREGIPASEYANREWLAFQVDRALQLDIVPPTILRDGPEGIGSAQAWEQGEPAVMLEGWREMVNQIKLELVALFDAVMMNSDRHDGNLLIAKDGSPHAIDNGLTSAARNGYIRSVALSRNTFGNKRLSDGARARLAQFQSSPQVQAALEKAFNVALGSDGPSIWWEFNARIEKYRSGAPLPEVRSI